MRPLQAAKKPKVVVIDNDGAMRHPLEWLNHSSGHFVLGYESAKSY